MQDLRKLKVLELKALANEHEVKFKQGIVKAELVKLLLPYATDYDEDEVENADFSTPSKSVLTAANLTVAEQLQLLEKQAELERERAEREAKLAQQKAEHEAMLAEREAREQAMLEERRAEREAALLKEQAMLKHELTMKELEKQDELNRWNRPSVSNVPNNMFRVDIAVKLVPKFDEKDVDLFFTNFEKIAELNKWPKANWCSVLQSLLIGKAARAYSKLTLHECGDYDVVKDRILNAYEHVPEYYKNKFRFCKKREHDSHTDYAQHVSIMCDRWLRAAGADDFDKLKELVMLEQFYNGVSSEVKVFLLEKPSDKLQATARKADEYAVVHRRYNNAANDHVINNVSKPKTETNNKPTETNNKPNNNNQSHPHKNREPKSKEHVICFYCHKPGHFAASCKAREQANKQYVGFVSQSTSQSSRQSHTENTPQDARLSQTGTNDNTVLFINHTTSDIQTCGISQSVKENLYHIPITFTADKDKIMIYAYRDTGAKLSLLRDGVLESKYLRPLHKSVQIFGIGGFVVGNFPAYEVTVQLSNNQEFKKVEIVLVPHNFELPDNMNMLCGNNVDMPLFSCFALTRAQAKQLTEEARPGPMHNVVAQETVIDECRAEVAQQVDIDKQDIGLQRMSVNLCDVGIEELIKLQKADATLAKVFEQVKDVNVENSVYYYLNDKGLLMRHFQHDDSYDVHEQIVAPYCLRGQLLQIAHDIPASGHLGMTKTRNRLLRYFY